MNSGIQSKLFEVIKHSLREDETLGLVVSDVLSLSTDAVYRRIRLETLMTIEEVRMRTNLGKSRAYEVMKELCTEGHALPVKGGWTAA